ncbi:hypothetical protein Patl1_04948 [Pistacia atlantica]|uniref:Uncharacterized protein n=1 Tax=Pistacia atlantica TaxID=434234 RepID=A0ACC1BU15_9ROSI|nr:hypothetical protein Patl1_04948 [Pistacia atlantica]
MARRKLLLLLKPFDVFPVRQSNANGVSHITNPQVFQHLDNRCKVHKDAINFCQDILSRKSVDWEPVFRNSYSKPISNVDLVVTIGGDGTLLQASHLMDDSVPVLGVNSDPTHVEEVEAFSNEFDATRSTGYLCAATVKNFEQVVKGCCWYLVEGRNHGGLLIYMPKLNTLIYMQQETCFIIWHCFQVIDKILDGQLVPSILSRISVCVNSEQLPTFALNDILVAHPCPATVSRFSFKINKDSLPCSPLVNCRSSGLRVSTAAGSTAAMLSAGGFIMPTLSQDLQYMVREPISPPAAYSNLMHGLVKSDESMEATWFSKEGFIYIDGSHIFHSIQNGDTIELSSKAPGLKVFLPPHLFS